MIFSTVIWVLALIMYNIVLGGIDFGPLELFAVKSVGLIAVANTFALVPFCGGWMALAVWWIGIVWLFKMEYWEAKVLVLIIWVLNFISRLAILTILAKAFQDNK